MCTLSQHDSFPIRYAPTLLATDISVNFRNSHAGLGRQESEPLTCLRHVICGKCGGVPGNGRGVINLMAPPWEIYLITAVLLTILYIMLQFTPNLYLASMIVFSYVPFSCIVETIEKKNKEMGTSVTLYLLILLCARKAKLLRRATLFSPGVKTHLFALYHTEM